MDRAQLKYLLHSGPSRVFDVRKLHHIDGNEPLFQISALNSAIFVKQSGALGFSDDEDLPPIATMIFMPYDRNRPEDGGESFFFSRKNLRGAFADSTKDKSITVEKLAADTELLSLFNKSPTFSPYIMRDILDRANTKIPDGYFNIPERESSMIKARIRARLRPLVATAFGGGSKSISETSIESLVEKLWQLTDLEELEPLMQALRITMQEAPEVFYYWLGIAFFENEYIKLQPNLGKLGAWMSTNSSPMDALPRALLDHYKHLILNARKLLQLQWKTAAGILLEYKETYDELIQGSGSAQRFIGFLRLSKSHFWTLGGCLGRLEQSFEIWDHVCSRMGYTNLNYERGKELFSVLNTINAPSSSDIGAATVLS